MTTFRDLRTHDDVFRWMVELNSRYPERYDLIRQISEQVQALPFETVQVVELCPGAGVLAEALLADIPTLRYIGIDSSALLLEAASDQLAFFGDRARLIRADLNGDEWLAELPPEIHAIVSLQSLHDLGTAAEVERIYRLAAELLHPGGLFINADLVVPPGGETDEHPGRIPIDRHLALLQTYGFAGVVCTFDRAKFGCCQGYAPEQK